MATAIAPVATRSIWAKVKIAKDGKPAPLNPIQVSKRREEEVQWLAEPKLRLHMVFEAETPFEDSEFVVPKGGSVCTGAVRKEAVEKTYKYTIKDELGNMLLDPEIIIKG
jgi:hypothetical protein